MGYRGVVHRSEARIGSSSRLLGFRVSQQTPLGMLLQALLCIQLNNKVALYVEPKARCVRNPLGT